MPDRLPCIRMVGGRVAAIEIAVGILIRLLKQKGQAAEIISGLVLQRKNLLNSFVETSVFLIKSMLIL